jgi:hypothetical protein
MNVYYSSSLWSNPKGLCGLPQRTNWQFEYLGTKRCIPYIYRFPKGIVFDIITFLDETKLHEFFEKYEDIENTLTPLQRKCVEQEHPYQTVPVKQIWINGKQVEEGFSSSSAISIPWARQEEVLIPVRKAYSSILKESTCFACERFFVPYPKTDSKVQKLLRLLRVNKVKPVKLFTHPVQGFSPVDMSIEMLLNEKEKKFCFVHPQTGVTHTLYFQNTETVEIPSGTDEKGSLYMTHAMYEIEPALPRADTLQFDGTIQYTPPPKDKLSPIATSSVGIIGGATAVGVLFRDRRNDGSCGLHGLPLQSCLSVPSFQKEATAHFILEGINTKRCDSKAYNF